MCGACIGCCSPFKPHCCGGISDTCPECIRNEERGQAWLKQVEIKVESNIGELKDYSNYELLAELARRMV